MATTAAQAVDPMALSHGVGVHGVPDGDIYDQDLDVTMDVDFGGLVAEAMHATARRQRDGGNQLAGLGGRDPVTGALSATRARATLASAPSRTRQRGGLVFRRPNLLTRIVMMGALLLLAGLAVMAALTANAIGDLVAAMRTDHRAKHSRVLDEPLPPDEELLDQQLFDNHLTARPDRLSALHARRGVLQLQDGAPDQALVHFRVARLNSATGLPVEDKIAEAQAFIAAGNTRQAVMQLEALERLRLSPDQRELVMGLLGRLYLR